MFTGKSFKHLQRWYHTVRHLKWQQIWYRVYYPLKRSWYRPREASPELVSRALAFPRTVFPEYACHKGIYDPAANSFSFLHRSHVFKGPVNWDFPDYGLLWTYHLNYFDWLNDASIAVSDRLDTIYHYLDQETELKTGLESYPSSLRIINWIRFISAYAIKDERIIRSLYRQGQRLSNFPEYQIMGNHLLENGISLMWLSIFFDKGLAYFRANFAWRELERQILKDGAHFERSIMYHSVLLQKIFDMIILNEYAGLPVSGARLQLLKTKAACMSSWLNEMTFQSGNYPCFGDCTRDESYPSGAALKNVARNLLTDAGNPFLSDSGYRKLAADGFELFFNCGKPGPAYQPGHAHADMFSFCLEYEGQPLIADTGISTYETGDRRALERSTAAHNTVCIADSNSSDVWQSFRIGKRASPVLLIDEKEKIVARHDGYLSRYGSYHERAVELVDGTLKITDVLDKNCKEQMALYLHLAPGLEPEVQQDGSIRITGSAMSLFFEGVSVSVADYDYCIGFNKQVKARKIKGLFTAPRAITIFKHETREVRRYNSWGETQFY